MNFQFETRFFLKFFREYLIFFKRRELENAKESKEIYMLEIYLIIKTLPMKAR